MWIKKTLIFSAFLLMTASCSDYLMICALHPFYLEKNVVLLPAIEGYWKARALDPVQPDSENGKTEVWRSADTLNTWKIVRTINRSTQKTKSGMDTTIITPMNYYEAKMVSMEKELIW